MRNFTKFGFIPLFTKPIYKRIFLNKIKTFDNFKKFIGYEDSNYPENKQYCLFENSKDCLRHSFVCCYSPCLHNQWHLKKLHKKITEEELKNIYSQYMEKPLRAEYKAKANNMYLTGRGYFASNCFYLFGGVYGAMEKIAFQKDIEYYQKNPEEYKKKRLNDAVSSLTRVVIDKTSLVHPFDGGDTYIYISFKSLDKDLTYLSLRITQYDENRLSAYLVDKINYVFDSKFKLDTLFTEKEHLKFNKTCLNKEFYIHALAGRSDQVLPYEGDGFYKLTDKFILEHKWESK